MYGLLSLCYCCCCETLVRAYLVRANKLYMIETPKMIDITQNIKSHERELKTFHIHLMSLAQKAI